MALHGHAYAEDDPEGFMGAPEVIRRLRDYADERSLPISEGCVVHRVGPESGGYDIDSSRGLIHAQAVVVATGEYRRRGCPGPLRARTRPHRAALQRLPVPASYPRRGAVIGSDQSGAQIARTCATVVAACTGHWPSGIRTRRLRGRTR